MELRMKESYGKGLANHPGPELCGGGGDTAAEALDRGKRRPGIQLRNKSVRRADLILTRGRQHGD